MNASQMMADRPQDAARRIEECRAAQEPYIREIVKIYCLATPRWIIHKDGTITQADDGLPPALREWRDFLQERVREVGQRYFPTKGT